MECPKCDGVLTHDEVDIGVGTMAGNYRCDFCGWHEEDELDDLFERPKEDNPPHPSKKGMDRFYRG